MNREALKLAMEGLEWIHRVSAMDYEYQQKALDSLNAIYKALAEQAPMNYYRADAEGNLERTDIHFAQPEQKPVAWANLNALSEQINSVNCGTIYGLPSEAEGRVPLYTTPPQRTWVGLTDEEIKLQWSEFWETECHPWAIDFAKAIEAKLRSKNNDT